MKPLLALGLALVMLAPGCGDDAGGRLSKHDFLAKGDAICGKYNSQANKVAESLGTTLQDIAHAIDKVIPIARTEWTELKKLRPPAQDQTTFDAWIAAGFRQIEEAKKLRDAAAKRDLAAFRAHFATVRTSQSDERRRAHRLGLRVCGT